MLRISGAISLCAALLFSPPAKAAIQTVFVSNSNNFSPANFTIASGDTVRWVWVQGTHTTTSTTVPAGAVPWDEQLNGTPSTDTFLYKACVAGIYSYKCTPHVPAVTGSFTVLSLPLPVITASALQFCPGDSVLLSTTAVPGYGYQWKMALNNVGTNSTLYTVTAGGSYTVTVSTSCGQTGQSLATTIGAAPLPIINIANSSKFLCAGKCDSVTLSGNVPGTSYTYSVQGIPGLNPVMTNPFPLCNPAVPANITGLYIFTLNATTPPGCTGSRTDTITGLLTPVSAFSHTHILNTYTFTNNSTDTGAAGTTWLWNFGEGTPTSPLKNPVHTYSTYGNKTVSLKVTNSTTGCTHTSTEIVTPVGISSLQILGDVHFYPNPANAKLIITGLKYGRAELLDATSRIIASATANATDKTELDMRNVPAGFYILRLSNSGGTGIERVSVIH